MQKFHHGDWVRVADNHPFRHCGEAIIIASYAEQFGGDRGSSYTVHFRDRGQVSWYDEAVMTLIEPGRPDKLQAWRDELAATRRKQSDLDWIFANGPDVLAEASGASIGALAESLGVRNLWGTNGEGMTYYTNAIAVLSLAGVYLLAGDKAGWLAKCAELVALNEWTRACPSGAATNGGAMKGKKKKC